MCHIYSFLYPSLTILFFPLSLSLLSAVEVRQSRVLFHRSTDAELETQKISHTFGTLVSKVQQSLEKQGVTVDSFIDHLKSIRGVENVLMYSQRSLVHSTMEQIQVQKSIAEIFPLISGYLSWFNHLPIEKMVDRFCDQDEDVRTTYRAFKLQFEDFCVQMVTECHKHSFGFERKKDAAKIIVKFDLMASVAKVNELVAIRNIVALYLKVKKQSLYVSSAECNLTTQVVFLAPLFVAEAAFPLTTEQEKSLAQCGVLQIECSSYRFSSPAWSQEREVGWRVVTGTNHMRDEGGREWMLADREGWLVLIMYGMRGEGGREVWTLIMHSVYQYSWHYCSIHLSSSNSPLLWLRYLV